MRIAFACLAFLVSALFYAWIVIGLGVTYYRLPFNAFIRDVVGTRENINWTSLGAMAALLFAGTLFLCVGLSMLATGKQTRDKNSATQL